VVAKSEQVPVNTAKQSSPIVATSISTTKPVNTAVAKPKVNDALPTTYHSPVKRTFNQKSAAKTNKFNEKVNTARIKNVTTAGPKAVVSVVVGNGENAVNGCSRHMTGNKYFLIDYQEIDGRFVAFGGSPKGDLSRRLLMLGDGIQDELGVKTGSRKVNAARHDLVLLGENKNAEFHQIVDFLTTSSIHYALTIALAEPFNDVYVTHVHTKKVFTNMKRQNKDFSGRITPLFASMLVPEVVEGEGSGQPSEPQPPSSTAPPSQVTTVATQHQKTHKPRRAKRDRDTEIPQF
ncbi:hypothetical protein Tco_1095778, partial [Tanacetum coccineum]